MSSRPSFLSISPLGAHTAAATDAVVTITMQPNAGILLLEAQGASCRYTIDGSNPTATTGFLLGSEAGLVRLDLTPGTEVKVLGAGGNVNYQQCRRF